MLLLALAAGCQALPAARAPLALGAAQGGARLALTLPPTQLGARATQAHTLAPEATLRLTVLGGDLAATVSVDVPQAQGARTLQVEGLPVGANRVLWLQALDPAERPMPGAEWLAVATLATGSNQVTLSSATTAAGRVYRRWLATDRRALALRADAKEVARRLEGLKQTTRIPHHALIDAEGWADAVALASGSLDVAGAFAIAPGSVLVSVAGAPHAVGATLWLDDPVSPSQHGVSSETSQTGGRYRVGPVMPGTWTAWVAVPGFGVASRSVSVPVGGEASVSVAFAGWEAGPKLPVALGNAGYATDGRHLYVVGGVVRGGAPTAQCWQLDTHATPLAWQPMPDLPSARDGAALALVAGKLYAVGGYTKGQGYRKDAVALDLAAPQLGWAPLPDVPAVNGRSLSALGYPVGAFARDGKLTVLINVFADAVSEAPYDRSHAAQYDPGAGTWQVDPTGLPTIRTPRVRAGFAAFTGAGGSTVVVAGGDKPDIQENRGSYGFLFRSAVPRVEGLDLSRAQWAGWADLPTPRSELSLAHSGASLYAAGGVDNQEHALETVERFDLATRRWLPGPPLATPRSSFGLLAAGGRLWAIGGAPSLFLNDGVGASARVLDEVEVLTLEAAP